MGLRAALRRPGGERAAGRRPAGAAALGPGGRRVERDRRIVVARGRPRGAGAAPRGQRVVGRRGAGRVRSGIRHARAAAHRRIGLGRSRARGGRRRIGGRPAHRAGGGPRHRGAAAGQRPRRRREARDAPTATRVILDAPLGLQQKIPVALALAQEFDRTPRGAVPDLGGVFDRAGAADDATLRGVRDDLVGAIEASLTRSFRAAYLVSAAFALLALIPVGVRAAGDEGGAVRRPPPRRSPAWPWCIAGALAGRCRGRRGGEDLGRSQIVTDRCTPPRVRESGGGFDATLQGVILDGLAGAACDLHVSREDLVLSFGSGSAATVGWDSATVEQAVRAGLVRSIDESEKRGSLNCVRRRALPRGSRQRADPGPHPRCGRPPGPREHRLRRPAQPDRLAPRSGARPTASWAWPWASR